ncbi:uncharacterized protein LTR77_000998 [Saxophila tyrrhenica]|uniref:PDZ GRASP-type domain-containing protein n=1 Tax=Saxophila tyrrhenica TaxID=1690608 RepID=A0AAV9PU41_9PEZI|nr:hypothetical protein LTR77_000998 [Saxophila tyrrhenica]
MANMFGALNRFISRLDSDPNAIPTTKGSPSTQLPSTYGFQVLRNPDQNIPLDPWFDFLIGINGRTIDNPDPNLLAQEIRNCAGSTISLGVYGTKGSSIREIYATVPPDGAGLGLSLQWAPLALGEDVWHILDVMPNSPADVAGLLPYGDYVIGSPEGVLRGEGALGELVERWLERGLRLFVYNHEYDVTRLVTITPSRAWGGDGALGCVLGYGALHRVPAPLTEPAQGPGETLFESGNEYSLPQPGGEEAVSEGQGGQEFLVPANMQVPSTSPPPPTSGGGPPPAGKARKQRAHHSAVPAAGLDDYFAEGEQKSRELEGDKSPKPTGNLPPPPPKGGPPKVASPAPSTE